MSSSSHTYTVPNASNRKRIIQSKPELANAHTESLKQHCSQDEDTKARGQAKGKGKSHHQTSKEVHYAQGHLSWVQAMASVETANVGKGFIIEIEGNGIVVVLYGYGLGGLTVS